MMPPKPKFSKEEIISVALELVSEKGMEALTARELGARLGSSARPIFTVFNSMEEVQEGVKRAAIKRFESYAKKAMVHGNTPNEVRADTEGMETAYDLGRNMAWMVKALHGEEHP